MTLEFARNLNQLKQFILRFFKSKNDVKTTSQKKNWTASKISFKVKVLNF